MGIIFKNGDGEYQCGVFSCNDFSIRKKCSAASLNVKNSFNQTVC